MYKRNYMKFDPNKNKNKKILGKMNQRGSSRTRRGLTLVLQNVLTHDEIKEFQGKTYRDLSLADLIMLNKETDVKDLFETSDYNLQQMIKKPPFGINMIDEACKNANVRIEFLEWLKYHGAKIDNNLYSPACRYAAINGRLDIIEWLISFVENPIKYINVSHAFEYAAKSGQIVVLEWIMGFTNNSPGEENIIHAVEFAITNNKLNVIKWLNIHFPIVFASYANNVFLYSSINEEVADWLFEKGYESARSEYNKLVLYNTILHGNLDKLKLLSSRQRTELQLKIYMDLAAEKGYNEILEWLYEQGGVFSKKAFSKATQNGHLETLEFLFEHIDRLSNDNIQKIYEEILQEAINYGHTHILEFILTQNPSLYSYLKPYFNSSVVSNGHLNMIKWYIKNEIQISNPLKQSIENGWYEQTKFLIEQGFKISKPSLKRSLKKAKEKTYFRIKELFYS